ncbi:MAG: hypothetical protein ACLPYZ_06475 [Limisphaerales bacterium]
MNEYSIEIFLRAHESQRKFDYFICSVAGALFAYIAQTYAPQKLDSLFSYLQTFSLPILAISFWAGIRRIQTANKLTYIDYALSEARENISHITEQLRGDFTQYTNNTTGERVTRESLELKRQNRLKDVSEYGKQSLNEMPRSRRLGRAQLFFLLLGFGLIFSARALQPYQSDFSRRMNATDQTTNRPAQTPVEIQSSKPPK